MSTTTYKNRCNTRVRLNEELSWGTELGRVASTKPINNHKNIRPKRYLQHNKQKRYLFVI